MNRPGSRGLSGDGDGYAPKVGARQGEFSVLLRSRVLDYNLHFEPFEAELSYFLST